MNYTTFTRGLFVPNTTARLGAIAKITKIGVLFKGPKNYNEMENKIKINCVIGIDPGSNGGIAIFIPGMKTKAIKMPKDNSELAGMFQYYAESYKPIIFLEKLSVRPDDVAVGTDGKPNMGKIFRIQKMMANFEHLKALIETAGIPYVMVHPASWQTKLKLRVRGEQEEKADRKRRYVAKAGEWYPGVKVTLWNADALLIMHFGRWALVNDINWVRQNLPTREHSKLF